MTGVRHLRRAAVGLLAALCVVGVASADRPGAEVGIAADTSTFQAGNIISDAVFYDSTSMTADQIQSFLNTKGAACSAGPDAPCLKNYVMDTTTQPADSYCLRQYTGASGTPAAQIIANVAAACGINPRVLLVVLQKEQGLVTASAPTAWAYQRAMGYGCPDSMNGACSAYYPGLFDQLYFAAKQFKRYASNPTRYSFVPGMTNLIAWSPQASCGSSAVYIQNQATAGLYNYTPYQPNRNALAAGYGASSDRCASYGNRNFWMYFTDWFGSTQTLGRDPDAPVGTLDGASGGPGTISVSGWTYDPDAVTTSIDVAIYVDGVRAAAVTANAARPDVAAVFPGVGEAHGFLATVPATAGPRTACVYASNILAGYTNPLLGCWTVTVAPGPPQALLRDSNSPGIADASLTRGAPGDQLLSCDWTGAGTDTIGTFRDGVFTLYASNAPDAAVIARFPYGNPGDIAVCGDWDGDHKDTVGVWRQGAFYLRNSNSPGAANGRVVFGNTSGVVPVVGDWNGDGFATPGVYQNGAFYITNSNTRPTTDGVFRFGDPGDVPIAGDWSGSGRASIGVWRAGTFYLASDPSAGVADLVVQYGTATDRPLTGDWNGDHKDTIGVVRR